MAGQTPDNGAHAGLFDSIKSLAATGLTIAQTRLELLSTELAEEKERLLSLLLLGVAALFFVGLGIIFVAIFLTVAFWQSRLLVLGLFSVIFLGAGIAAMSVVMKMARAQSRLFSASLSELSKDREHLS